MSIKNTSNLALIIPTLHQNPAKPFLKWPGGKTQLLEQFKNFFPVELYRGSIDKYFEPFVGSGAVFFYIIQNYRVKRAFINDVNKELIIAYKVVQQDVTKLIEFLERFEKEYIPLSDKERRRYFYELRASYNLNRFNVDYSKYSENWIPRTAQIIFLNKTCYNGLFRFNSKGDFNTPYGTYKRPKILNAENLLRVNKILQNVEIECGDFEIIKKKVSKNSFIYFDPPYRPISKTSSFTSYSTFTFDDKQQIRLAKFINDMNLLGVKFMLSNSNPKNENPEDSFFENLYSKFEINTVYANRMINCKGDRRGKISEIIITNYQPRKTEN